ncbi:MAG: GNAT family N-acetyltransferase, partial [Corynebacteriales bacterium]|nr:GNAT family N-acetyltransferase [Mycobacteriales bacterium]
MTSSALRTSPGTNRTASPSSFATASPGLPGRSRTTTFALSPPTLRRATADDLPALFEADGRGFGFHYTEQAREDATPTLDPSRFLVAVDGDTIVGVTGSYAFDVTPPGGKPVATEGVTWVSVAPTHRRRGVLRALFDEQHRGFVAAGTPLAVLTASEGGIYGRFGYGVATASRDVEIDRARAVLRADVPDPAGVRFTDTEEVRERVPAIHRR